MLAGSSLAMLYEGLHSAPVILSSVQAMVTVQA